MADLTVVFATLLQGLAPGIRSQDSYWVRIRFRTTRRSDGRTMNCAFRVRREHLVHGLSFGHHRRPASLLLHTIEVMDRAYTPA